MSAFSELGQLGQSSARIQQSARSKTTDKMKQTMEGLSEESDSTTGQQSEKNFDEELMDAAEKVEGYLLSFMMKQMRETIKDNGGMFEQSKAEKIFRSRLDSKLAQRMAESKNFGIAESVYDQFSADKAR